MVISGRDSMPAQVASTTMPSMRGLMAVEEPTITEVPEWMAAL